MLGRKQRSQVARSFLIRYLFETSAKLLLKFVFLKYFLYLYRMKQKLSSPSFADLFLGQRKVKQTFFSQINTVIDWAPIRAIIEVAYTKGYKSTGRPSYDSLVLFKIELLRTWYGLSDGEVEDQVNDRLSFSRFAGLGMEDIVPDSTTRRTFKNTCAAYYGIHCLQLIPNARDYCVKFYQII